MAGRVERTIRLSSTTMNRAAPVMAMTALDFAGLMAAFGRAQVLFDRHRTNLVRRVSNSSVRIVYAALYGNNDRRRDFVRRRARRAERPGTAPDRAHARRGGGGARLGTVRPAGHEAAREPPLQGAARG